MIVLVPGIAEPTGAHAQTADEADFAVNRDRLAMVAREPAKRAIEPWRIEHADVDTRLAHHRGQAVHARRAEPIVENAHTHAVATFPGERVRKFPADIVGREDVHLEQYLPLGRADRGKPRREVLFGVEQELHGIALARRGAGGALERAIADLRKRIGRRHCGRMQWHS